MQSWESVSLASNPEMEESGRLAFANRIFVTRRPETRGFRITMRAAGVLTTVGLIMMLAVSPGCSKHKGKPPGNKKDVRCLDFANEVLAAYQVVVSVKIKASDIKPNVLMGAKHRNLEAGCRSGSIPAKVVSCVLNLEDKTPTAVIACLPKSLRPATRTSDDEDVDSDSDSDLGAGSTGDDSDDNDEPDAP